MSELARRVIVALIGAPIALLIIWYGDSPLAALASALAAIAAHELFRIAAKAGSRPLVWWGVLLAAALPLTAHAQYLGVLAPPPVSFVIVPLVTMAACLWARGPGGGPLAAASITLVGALYTGGTLSFVYALRYFGYAVGDTAGAVVVLLPVLLTWASDIGAFFAGRAIGGPKLMPSVSPGKTISGAIGAVVTTVLVCLVYVAYVLKPYAQLAFSPWGVVAFGVAVSVTAQVGDLVESMFKREAAVKDSGTLFPGHGGVLDRLDSLFFVLPVSFALYQGLVIAVPTP